MMRAENVLLQCIGTVSSVKPDFLMGDFYAGDSFLACSDGFRHNLTEADIYEYCHTTLERWTGLCRSGWRIRIL